MTIQPICRLVIKGLAGDGVGVEVVVHVDPVQVVSGDEVAHLGKPGIEEQLLAISDKPLRMLLRGMPRCDVGRDVGHGAVGIDPGM